MSFKNILLAVFIFFAVVGIGLFAFSGRSGNQDQGAKGEVTIWGTLPQRDFMSFVEEVNNTYEDRLSVRYVEKRPGVYEDELIEALASGEGPDIIIFPDDFIIKHSNKVISIPYDNYSLRDFRDRFIEAGEIFLSDEGITALPFYIDPLVYYWNRDIFSNEAIPTPPETWDDVLDVVPELTLKDVNFNITRSAIALGEYENISNAKEILFALLLQAGGNLVDFRSGQYQSTLTGTNQSNSVNSAIGFYTGFSNPSNRSYSWNRSLPASKDMFLSGDLATYLGFASEAEDLEQKNPNLDFDVSVFPQIEDTSVRKTFADVRGLAVLRASGNKSDAFATIYDLTSPEVIEIFSKNFELPPVSRELISRRPSGELQPIFYESAIISEGILDPDYNSTSSILNEMIGNITSGRENISGAIRGASNRLQLIIDNI